MATNYVQKGDVVTVVSPAGGVSSGDGVMIGSLFGVATHDAAAAASLELAVVGVFTLPADTALAISQGDPVYWDDTNSWVDATTAAQQCVGVAVADQDTVAETVDVLIGRVPDTDTT